VENQLSLVSYGFKKILLAFKLRLIRILSYSARELSFGMTDSGWLGISAQKGVYFEFRHQLLNTTQHSACLPFTTLCFHIRSVIHRLSL